MNSSLEKKIIEDFKMLSSDKREELLVKLFSLAKYKDSPKTKESCCPHCSSIHFWKNGKLKDRQRYLCKRCGKSFNIFTNTPLSYTKKDMDLWLNYCNELISQTSLRECAKKLDIALSTAFFWRHKLLDAIRENKVKSQLKDEVQLTQIFFRESFKGNHSKSDFKMPRKSYKHKFSWFKEGLGFPNNVCVLVSNDSEDFAMANTCCIGNPSAEDLIRVYKKYIKEHTTVFFPSNNEYKKFAATLTLTQNNISTINSNDTSNLFKVRQYALNMKSFIKIYRGVATKYLQNYVDLFVFLKDPFIDYPMYLKGETPFKNTNFKDRPPIYS